MRGIRRLVVFASFAVYYATDAWVVVRVPFPLTRSTTVPSYALASSVTTTTATHSTTNKVLATPRTNVSSLQRANQLAQIVLRFMGPILVTLFKTGLPQNEEQWNDFWSEEELADRFTAALEEMGPTAVKFGQSLSARPDIVPKRLAISLSNLQDQMQPFDSDIAKRIIQEEVGNVSSEECASILSTLSDPVAAASIGCVYSALLSDQRKVAIKVQRPGISHIVEQDAILWRQVANMLEMPRSTNGQRWIRTDLTGAVEEFMNRLREELDYRNEARNLETFAALYSHRRNATLTGTSSKKIHVVVPRLHRELCSKNVLVMEWIDAEPLVDLESEASRKESYNLILQGIDCTFSQLLETGVMHADPHGGNLLKVPNPPGSVSATGDAGPILGYVDFGLLATIPHTVRDGLVCAVAELVFERNVTAVANLCGELALIPDSVVQDPMEMQALGRELQAALDEVLIYPTGDETTSATTSSSSTVPNLRFDKLLNVLSRLVPAFQFKLPPYFLNNARALATLEGMAREIDPEFNVLRFLYPYALNRIVANPSGSPVVTETLDHLITNHDTGKVERAKIRRLVRDMSLLTGFSKRQLFLDVLHSSNGLALIRRIVKDQWSIRPRGRQSKGLDRRKRKRRNRRSSPYGDLFRL